MFQCGAIYRDAGSASLKSDEVREAGNRRGCEALRGKFGRGEQLPCSTDGGVETSGLNFQSGEQRRLLAPTEAQVFKV
jgi:hypothetical protein